MTFIVYIVAANRAPNFYITFIYHFYYHFAGSMYACTAHIHQNRPTFHRFARCNVINYEKKGVVLSCIWAVKSCGRLHSKHIILYSCIDNWHFVFYNFLVFVYPNINDSNHEQQQPSSTRIYLILFIRFEN